MPPLGYEKLVLSKFVPTWQAFISNIDWQVKARCVECYGNACAAHNGDYSTPIRCSIWNKDESLIARSPNIHNDKHEIDDFDLDIDDITEFSYQIDNCITELQQENIVSDKNALNNETKKTNNSCVIVSKGMDTYRILFYLLLYLKNPKHVHEVEDFDISKMDYYDIIYAGLFSLNFDLTELFLTQKFSPDNFSPNTIVSSENRNKVRQDVCDLPITYIAARSRLILVIGIDYSDYIEYRNCEINEITFISKILYTHSNNQNTDNNPISDFILPRMGYISRHSIKEREQLYTRGGVYCASAEVFLLDILCNSLLIECISGIVVMNAHKVCSDTRLSFLLNLYRNGNSLGFVKAISDDINAFSDVNIVNQFHCEDMSIHLLPRSNSLISGSLSRKNMQPETHEISVPLPPQLERIQTTLVTILKKIINQLGKDNTTKMLMAEIGFDLNTLIYEWNKISLLEKRLGKSSISSVWDKTSDDLNALSILSKLLHLSQKIDEISFLKKVDIARLKFIDSPWMWERDVLLFFKLSEERVFKVIDGKPPKIKCTISADTIYNVVKDITKGTNSTIVTLGLHAYDAMKYHLYELPVQILFRDYAEWRAQGCLLSHSNLNPNLSTHSISLDAKTHDLLARIKWVDSLFQDYLTKHSSSPVDTGDFSNILTNTVDVVAVVEGRRDFNELPIKPTIPQQLTCSNLHGFDDYTEMCNSASDLYSIKGLSNVFDSMVEGNVVIIQGNLGLFRQIELICSHVYLRQCYQAIYHLYHGTEDGVIINGEGIGIKVKVLILIYKDSIHSNSFSYHIDSEIKKWYRVSNSLKSVIAKPIIPNEIITSVNNTPTQLVIVDKREFKSPLPYQLFLDGLKIIPAFLKAGDYIITRDTCIERKSPQDLANSLTVGRLFNQVREMKKMYENVILLIEFDNFNFHLTPFGRMKGQFNRTYTRLITLCLLTNNLQLMWSNGPQVTSRLVRRLKENIAEPCTQQVRMELFEADSTSSLVEDFVKKIPCISDWMVYQITKKVKTLHDLSNMTSNTLEQRLGFNKNMANEVYKFFHTPISQMLAHSSSSVSTND